MHARAVQPRLPLLHVLTRSFPRPAPSASAGHRAASSFRHERAADPQAQMAARGVENTTRATGRLIDGSIRIGAGILPLPGVDICTTRPPSFSFIIRGGFCCPSPRVSGGSCQRAQCTACRSCDTPPSTLLTLTSASNVFPGRCGGKYLPKPYVSLWSVALFFYLPETHTPHAAVSESNHRLVPTILRTRPRELTYNATRRLRCGVSL